MINHYSCCTYVDNLAKSDEAIFPLQTLVLICLSLVEIKMILRWLKTQHSKN